MLSDFFYVLREEGLPVSLNEWLTLMEALSLDLADNSLTEFYYLARSLLVKNEAAFDKYDAAFIRCFGDNPANKEKPPEKAAAERSYNPDFFNPARYEDQKDPLPGGEADLGALNGDRAALAAHAPAGDGGGQKGKSAEQGGETGGYGSGPINPGLDTGGMTALKIAGRRRYRDYQDDNIKNIRQYEIALRNLRQLSSKYDGPKDELDLEATVEETGRNHGLLSLEWERPRRNSLKVLVLMDSMGSIYSHYEACKKLFNAAHRGAHFKEIKFFYFHNCIYGRIYKNQWLDIRESIPTEEFFRLYNGDWRMLIVGDAQMGEQELMRAGGVIEWSAEHNAEPGIVWLKRIARHYPYAAWLNPVPEYLWGREPNYTSIRSVEGIFPMFELTPGGIAQAVKKLRVRSG